MLSNTMLRLGMFLVGIPTALSANRALFPDLVVLRLGMELKMTAMSLFKVSLLHGFLSIVRAFNEYGLFLHKKLYSVLAQRRSR